MSKPNPPVLIRAAGRVLSQKNATNLQNAFALIAKTLIAANVINSTDLEVLIKEAGTQPEPKEEEINAEVIESVSQQVWVAARDFLENVQRATWQDRLRRTLTMFSREFQSLHEIDDEELELRYGKGASRAELTQKTLDECYSLLNELKNNHPGPTSEYNYVPPLYGYEMSSATPPGITQAGQTEVKPSTPPIQDVPLPADAAEAPDGETDEDLRAENRPPEKIKASASVAGATVEEVQIQVAFDRSINVSVSAEKGVNTNRIPFEGVLCSIDEPSPAIPAVGPGLPLYIPKEVAEACLNAGVSGLPLDADDSLSKHANQEITGVIQSGYIKGNEVYVTGFLWPWNQEKKVAAISANRDRLGMSMNASAYGHREMVDGKEVFWVDSLELLGANILYQDRATYRNTRLLSASSESWREIAAAAQDYEAAGSQTTDQENQQEGTFMNEELRKQLDEINDAIRASTRRQDELFTPLKASITDIEGQLKEIQAERATVKAELQAAADADRQKQEREKFVEQIVTVIDERLEAKLSEKLKGVVTSAGRGSRQPARQTTPLPLAASAANNAAPGTEQQKQIEIQLARLDGRLEEAQGNMQKTLTLLDEKRNLEAQLGLLSVAS
jgi:hypothetical protein